MVLSKHGVKKSESQKIEGDKKPVDPRGRQFNIIHIVLEYRRPLKNVKTQIKEKIDIREYK